LRQPEGVRALVCGVLSVHLPPEGVMATGYRGTRQADFGATGPAGKTIRHFPRKVWQALVDDLRDATPIYTRGRTCGYCGTPPSVGRAIHFTSQASELFRYRARSLICGTCRAAILTAREVRS
jgi:hypothetical protein